MFELGLTCTNSSGTWQISWQESEAVAPQGSKRAEVTLVEGEHPPSTVLLCSDDQAEICELNVEIFAAALQVGYHARSTLSCRASSFRWFTGSATPALSTTS
ncbi:MAG TPA: hypothetical protein VME46_19435 [Acidimicrobiales bacterium]|nr:hypothetical protein [Acidimicrobiales bacterium]